MPNTGGRSGYVSFGGWRGGHSFDKPQAEASKSH